MSRGRWGREGPPDEAYSRVTNPERFLPLHEAALRLIKRLIADYDVEMTEGYDLSVLGIGKDRLARPSIALSPSDSACAPITIAFDDFPGISARFGQWQENGFPSCGCDACDEDANGEIARMTRMFESIISGGFREAMKVPRFFGDGWLEESSLTPSGWRTFSKSRVNRTRALEMTGGRLYMEYEWKPWPRRRQSLNGESDI